MSADDNLYLKGRDEHDILSLRGDVWGADHAHTNLAFLEWLFGNAKPGEPVGVLIKQSGKAIAFAGLSRKLIRIDGHDLLLAYGMDFMAHPDIHGMGRGRVVLGLCIRWLKLAEELGCSAVLGFPNEDAAGIQSSPFVGLKRIFETALVVRPLATARPQQRIGHIPTWASTSALRVAACGADLRMHAHRAPRVDLQSVDRFGSEFDLLWESAAPSVAAGLVRNAGYLAWRYLHHPIYEYIRLCWRSNGRMRGFVVASPRRLFGLNALLLVDLLAEECDERIGTAMVKGLVAEGLRRCSDVVVTVAIPNSALYRLLTNCGFYHVPARFDPKPFRAFGTVFNSQAGGLLDPRSWYFTWGDTEVV